MQGKYKEAKSAYKKALKIDPDYTIAKEALDSLKDVGEAIRKANSLKIKRK
jgi:tetratricopeptide (TPR) repeat protein